VYSERRLAVRRPAGDRDRGSGMVQRSTVVIEVGTDCSPVARALRRLWATIRDPVSAGGGRVGSRLASGSDGRRSVRRATGLLGAETIETSYAYLHATSPFRGQARSDRGWPDRLQPRTRSDKSGMFSHGPSKC